MSKTSMFSLQNPKTRIGYKILACLLIAYGAASWAIDNGSPWLYLLTLGLCYLAIHYAFQLFEGMRHGRRGK